MNKKILIIISGVLIVVLGIFIATYTFGNGGEVIEKVKIEEITIEDIALESDGENFRYKGVLSTAESEYIEGVKIIFSNEEESVELYGYVGREVSVGEKINIEASTNADLSNLKTITYEKVGKID